MTIKEIIESKSYTVPNFNWKNVKVEVNINQSSFDIIRVVDFDKEDLTERFKHLDNIQRAIWRGICDKIFENCLTQVYWQVKRDIEYLNKVNKIRNKITNGIQANISR